MNDLIKQMLPSKLPSSEAGLLRVLRELLQSISLLGLWRAKFFEHTAFYGGTALRILYGLDRFSEDLDFSLLKASANFKFEKYRTILIKELESFGFDVSFEIKVKTSKTFINSAFLKANTYNQLMTIQAPENIISGVDKNVIVKIKFEVDTDPPPGFDTEMKYVFLPLQFAVRSYTLPSLFAGKMHAVLCRSWKSRVKGRDWYDLIWYVSHHPELNLMHLESRMRQSGHYAANESLTKKIMLNKLNEAIDRLDVDLARKEVASFVNDPRSLEIWSKDFFRAASEKIITE